MYSITSPFFFVLKSINKLLISVENLMKEILKLNASKPKTISLYHLF
jgi:hypothetical protein